jgi:hypothetical protein
MRLDRCALTKDADENSAPPTRSSRRPHQIVAHVGNYFTPFKNRGLFHSFKVSIVNGAAEAAFDIIDFDKSGLLDTTEIYAGVLLVYNKLGCIIHIAAPTREYTEELIHDIDEDHDGRLNLHEFKAFCLFLSRGLLMRVLVKLSVTVIFGPFLASAEMQFMPGVEEFRLLGGPGAVERCLLVLNIMVLVPLVLLFIDRAFLHWAHTAAINNAAEEQKYSRVADPEQG